MPIKANTLAFYPAPKLKYNKLEFFRTLNRLARRRIAILEVIKTVGGFRIFFTEDVDTQLGKRCYAALTQKAFNRYVLLVF